MGRSDHPKQPIRQGGSALLLLDAASVAGEATKLATVDDVFSGMLARNGPPPVWRRPPNYATIVRLILEQQVSLASATAAYRRLEARLGIVSPAAVAGSSDAELRGDGFSSQKASYVRGVARLILDEKLNPESLSKREDPRSELVAIRGIGPWTAACFEIFALGAADVWPTGDRAVYVSIGVNLGLDAVPVRKDADALADAWRPHRSTAARMLWHDYLGGRSYSESDDAGFA